MYNNQNLLVLFSILSLNKKLLLKYIQVKLDINNKKQIYLVGKIIFLQSHISTINISV